MTEEILSDGVETFSLAFDQMCPGLAFLGLNVLLGVRLRREVLHAVRKGGDAIGVVEGVLEYLQETSLEIGYPFEIGHFVLPFDEKRARLASPCLLGYSEVSPGRT